MIHINQAKQTFENYTKEYDMEERKIAIKIAHIKRVANQSKNIAIRLGLEQEDVQLAELIGLLHDIGRFEQVKQYHTFVDKDSVNHGKLAVQILFEQGKIRDFIQDTQYDEIIKTAILNHNKPKIEKDLSMKEELHSKIIRDADKVDILYILGQSPIQDTYCCDTMYQDEIKEEILQQYQQEHYIHYQDIQNGAERIIAHFAYVFDFNYDFALQVVQENKYLDILANKYEFEKQETREKIQQALEIAKQYMKQRLQ